MYKFIFSVIGIVSLLFAPVVDAATISGIIQTEDGEYGLCNALVTASTGTLAKSYVYKSMSKCGTFEIDVDLSGDYEVTVTKNGWLFEPETINTEVESGDSEVAGLLFVASKIPYSPPIPDIPSGCSLLTNGEYLNEDLGVQKLSAYYFDNSEVLGLDYFYVANQVTYDKVVSASIPTTVLSKSILPLEFDISYTPVLSTTSIVPLQITLTIQKIEVGKLLWDTFREDNSVKTVISELRPVKIINGEAVDLVSLVSEDKLESFFTVDFRDAERIINITYRICIVDDEPDSETPYIYSIYNNINSMFVYYDGKKDGHVKDPICFTKKQYIITPTPTISPTEIPKPTSVASGGGGGCNVSGNIPYIAILLLMFTPMLVLHNYK